MNKKTDGFFFNWHVTISIDSEKIFSIDFRKIVFLYVREEGRCQSVCELKAAAHEN